MTILDAMEDPSAFGPLFADGDWKAWRAFLAAVFGLRMGPNLASVYRDHTGRATVPERPVDEAWMVVGRGGGKALALETPIPTPTGWTTMGAIGVGARVFDRHGRTARVIATTDVAVGRPCYRVALSDGSTFVCDEAHEWVVEDRQCRRGLARQRPRRLEPMRTRWGGVTSRVCGGRTARAAVLTAKEMATRVRVARPDGEIERNLAVPLAAPLDLPEQELPIDPYVLGVWLGDGDSAAAAITTADEEIVWSLRAVGHDVRPWAAPLRYGVAGGLLGALRELGVLRNKHIPARYLRASSAQRWALLHGLMDTDGYCARNGRAVFYTTSDRLRDGTAELAASLGLRPVVREKRAMLHGKDCGPCYSVTMTSDKPLFRLARKRARQPARCWQTGRRYVVAVDPCESVPVRCIQVDAPDGTFLVGRGMVPTHNSRIAALIAVYLAAFHDWRPVLAPGQLALVPVIAADKDQARVAFGYITAMIDAVPALRRLVKGKPRAAAVDLKTGVTIEIRAASFRTIRGPALVAGVLDEIAYWMTGEASLNPDHEIVNAMRPGLARVPGSILIGLSSPYARKGVLWDVQEQHFGKDGDPVLVWKATTREMNPSFPDAAIQKALLDDEPKARAEYLAEFRSDLESYVSAEVVQAATMVGRYELAPRPGVIYRAFTDPSGGSQDSFTLAIGHVEEGRGIVDCLRERRPPFKPSEVVAEFADVLKGYGCTLVRGDHYAGEWPREQFSKHGIAYQLAEQNKSDLYVGFLPALNSGRVELLDVPRLTQQLKQLERRTSRAGKDSVDHPPGGHDDVANAVAGLLAPLVGGVSDTLGFYRYLDEGGLSVEALQVAAVPVAAEPVAPSQWAGRAVPPRPVARERKLAGLADLEARELARR